MRWIYGSQTVCLWVCERESVCKSLCVGGKNGDLVEQTEKKHDGLTKDPNTKSAKCFLSSWNLILNWSASSSLR